MPNSLMDMFQPRNLQGDTPIGYGDALAQRSNSLIGLGLGLMSPYDQMRGQSPFTNALRGFQSGSETDTANAYRQRQMAEAAAARKQAQSNFERQFARSGESEFDKEQRDIAQYKGTPQEQAVRDFYINKRGSPWKLGEVMDENLGEKVPAWINERTQEIRPATSGIGTPAAPAAPNAFANAPNPLAGGVPVQTGIGPAGGGGVGYGQAGMGGGGFGTGLGATTLMPGTSTPTATPRGPQDLPPRTGFKAFEPEQKLRKEFEDVAKPYITARQAYTKMQASQDNAAGDIALIFGYMKMLDPPSTVREGEFATAANSGGIEDRIRNTYNKLLSGERLTPQQREQFKGQGAAVWEQYDKEYQPRIEQFRNIARQYRIDPSRIIPDIGPTPTVPKREPAAPAVGGSRTAPSATGGDEQMTGAPPRPRSVPPGSAYSPSRHMWRSPDGVMFDQNGRRYDGQR